MAYKSGNFGWPQDVHILMQVPLYSYEGTLVYSWIASYMVTSSYKTCDSRNMNYI